MPASAAILLPLCLWYKNCLLYTSHLGYEEYERSDNPDCRNGVKPKKLRSSYGEIPIDVPQDRDGDFQPQIVPKRKKDISEIESKIIAMSAKGMTTRQISDIVEDIYGFEVSEAMVTAVTNKILPQIEEWQQRPLSSVCLLYTSIQSRGKRR